MAIPSVDLFMVETEAGTHFPGQSKAPQALIEAAGLQSQLESIGFKTRVHDALGGDDGAKNAAKWQPASRVNGVRNEDNTLRVMNAVNKTLQQQLSSSPSFPIIIGGDCSITPAVLSALWATHPPGNKVGLSYMDGDVDLTLPSQTEAEGSSAILDSMTMTHLTGREGGLDSMREFTRPDGTPLVRPDNVVLFGFDPLQPSTEHWVYLLENGFKAFVRPTVQGNAVGRMLEALDWLSKRVDAIYIHFDVDIIDCGNFPLANYPHYAGVDVQKALAALETALAYDKVQGLTVTEINPNNDPDGRMVAHVVESIVEGMSGRRGLTHET